LIARFLRKQTPAKIGPLPRHVPGAFTVMSKATIAVPGLKVAVSLSGDALPRDLVPPEGPPGEPVIDLVLGDGLLTARARINGKNYRKMLKQIAEVGAANVVVVLQGLLRPPTAPGEPFVMEGAGFQVTVKTPKPVDSSGDTSTGHDSMGG
jgi:hypothetical protein